MLAKQSPSSQHPQDKFLKKAKEINMSKED
jgi:hypothetical protein